MIYYGVILYNHINILLAAPIRRYKFSIDIILWFCDNINSIP